MADEKTYTPREVALKVLAKAQELLGKTEMFQPSPKVAEHQSGMHTVGYYSKTPFEKAEGDHGLEPFHKSEMDKHGMSPEEIRAKMKKHGLSPEEIKSKMNKGTAQPAPSLAMSEKNPDEKQDAKLGEEVEGLCEHHMLENKDAERKEGHKIVKSEMCKMCKSDMRKAELNDLYAIINAVEALEKAEIKHEGANENEIGTKFVKSDDAGQGSGIKEKPSDPMHPRVKEEGVERDYKDFETQPGHSSTSANDHREEKQSPPESNPKENAEGNNPEAGSAPINKGHAASGTKGVHKLSFFMGHRNHKNGMKKGIALS